MSTWQTTLCRLCMIVVISGAGAPAAPVSMEAFLKQKKTWSTQIGKLQVLEGRCGSASQLRMTMKGCSLEFSSKRRLPRLTRRGGKDVNVLVTGRLLKEGAKLFFSVEKVKVQPGDIEMFNQRRPRGARAKPEEWYRLSDWAAKRGRFYKDRELLEKARVAEREGLSLSRRTADGRSDRLEEVVQLAVSRKADPRTVQLIRHELLWALKTDAGRDLPKLKQLRKRIGRELTGSRDTTNRLGEKQRALYLRDPVRVYEEADDVEQRAMHRFLFASLSLEIILAEARSDGSNARAIASRIRQEVPERSDVADTWELKALERDRRRVGQMNQGEMEEMVARLRAAKQPDLAEEAIDTWLTVQQRSLLELGTAGRMQLADLYLSLKNDPRTAVEWLTRADDLSPGNAEVAKRLKRLGYVKRQGRWVSEDGGETVATRRKQFDAGGIREGMVGREVLSQHGKPGSVSRVAAAGLVSEIWVYERFVVYLVRKGGNGLATVRAVRNLRARR